MKRVIVDFKKLTENILNMLVEKYPDGYNDEDIITFKNAAGETVEAVEVRTDETIYLVKVSVRLEQKMEDFLEDMEDETSEMPADDEIEFDNEDLAETDQDED